MDVRRGPMTRSGVGAFEDSLETVDTRDLSREKDSPFPFWIFDLNVTKKKESPKKRSSIDIKFEEKDIFALYGGLISILKKTFGKAYNRRTENPST